MGHLARMQTFTELQGASEYNGQFDDCTKEVSLEVRMEDESVEVD